MLKTEFDKLIGRESSLSEFECAHEIYMFLGERVDKYLFCRWWVKTREDIDLRVVFFHLTCMAQLYLRKLEKTIKL